MKDWILYDVFYIVYSDLLYIFYSNFEMLHEVFSVLRLCVLHLQHSYCTCKMFGGVHWILYANLSHVSCCFFKVFMRCFYGVLNIVLIVA